jgi:hypothetical protein
MSGSSKAIINNSTFKSFEYSQFNERFQNSKILSLPNEILALICTWLSLGDIFNLQQSCVHMYHQISRVIPYTCQEDHLICFSRKIRRHLNNIDGVICYYKNVLPYIDLIHSKSNSQAIIKESNLAPIHRSVLLHCLRRYKIDKSERWSNVIEYIISVYGWIITDLIFLCVLTSYDSYYDRWVKIIKGDKYSEINDLSDESKNKVVTLFETVVKISETNIFDKMIVDFPMKILLNQFMLNQKMLELAIYQDPIIFKKLLDLIGDKIINDEYIFCSFTNLLLSIHNIPAPNHLHIFTILIKFVCSLSNISNIEDIIQIIEKVWAYVVTHNRVDFMKILFTPSINIFPPSSNYLIRLVITGNAEHNWSKDILNHLIQVGKYRFTPMVLMQLIKDCCHYDNEEMFQYFIKMYPTPETLLLDCFVMSLDNNSNKILKYLVDIMQIKLDSNDKLSNYKNTISPLPPNNILFLRCLKRASDSDDWLIKHFLTSQNVVLPTVETLSLAISLVKSFTIPKTIAWVKKFIKMGGSLAYNDYRPLKYILTHTRKTYCVQIKKLMTPEQCDEYLRCETNEDKKILFANLN